MTLPRYFTIWGHSVNGYKVFLCIGVYLGTLVSAAVAERRGVSPLRMGAAALVCGLLGIAGARIYHVSMFARRYLSERSWTAVLNAKDGGAAVFGGLFLIAPLSFSVASLFHIPVVAFWDYLSAGIIVGGFWVRCGCVFNGCCAGRETRRWYGVWLHDVRGVRKRRTPVQFMEMGWWLLGVGAYAWLWRRAPPPGSWTWGLFLWYGFGRFWLEPLREVPAIVAGRVRINQIVAGVIAVVGGCAFVFNMHAN